MTWTMDPEIYACPTHHVDLTEQVYLEATAQPTIVTGGGGIGTDGADAADAPLEDWDPRGPFVVVVTCPGTVDAGNGDAKPHEQQFGGVVR